MLVLTRKRQEKIIVTLEDGRTITLQLVDVRHRAARIGIVAPRSIAIMREEIMDSDEEGSDDAHHNRL